MNLHKIDHLKALLKRYPRRAMYFPGYSFVIFLFFFIVIALFYDYNDILLKPTQSIHQWRQCDCLSMAMNYYEGDNPFFEPSVHYLGHDGSGKTMSEFPVIYFIVGNLWKVCGHHEYLYRLIVVLMYFLGLLALFKTFEYVLKDSVIALVGALLMFTSPTLVYYGNNFLMDMPAFSLALIGLFFFFRYYQTGYEKYLFIFCIFYIFAGLLKITSLISFIAITGLFGLELINVKLRPDRKVFIQSKFKIIVLFVSVLLIQFVWYSYANAYNEKHNSGIFLIGIMPIWELTKAQIIDVLDHVNYHIRMDYFRRDTQILFVIMFLSLFFLKKRNNRIYFLLPFILWIGFIFYLILFFQPLRNHDYYTINLFILIPVVVLAFFKMIKERYNQVFSSIWFKILLVVFLVYNVSFAKEMLEKRYDPKGWQDEMFVKYYKPFMEIEPYLRSLGIQKDDKVLSLSDQSINITLYLMDQKGWTNYGIQGDSIRIQQKIAQGAKYLLTFRKETQEKAGIKPFTRNKMGSYKNIDIFAL